MRRKEFCPRITRKDANRNPGGRETFLRKCYDLSTMVCSCLKSGVLTIAMVAVYFVASLAQTATTTPEDGTPIKVDTVLLNIPVIVSDRDGRNIPGLTKDNFI